MPELCHQPIGRRDFLITSVIAGASMALHVRRSLAAEPAASPQDEVRLALIADTHIGPGEGAKDKRGFDPVEQLRRVVPDIIATSPRGVILNGDAASRAGLPEDYRELKTLIEPLAATAPVYVGFGNHDDRANFAGVFSDPLPTGLDAGVRDHRVLVIEESFVRFVLLDSLLLVNTATGLLGWHQRAWLGEYLAAHGDRPVVLFVHHTLGDGDRDLLDSDRFFRILAAHRHVKAVFYGHSHAWDPGGERDGVRLINLPSLGYNFWDGEPVGWVDARFRPDGVDLTLHAIAGNRDKDGHVHRIQWG